MAAVLLGPRAVLEERWIEPDVGDDIDVYLQRSEDSVPGIRAGEEKAVVWADPQLRAQTPLSIVYFHGFSADRHEVDPLVQRLADSLGANVYFPRLTGHARDGAAMGEASAEDWLDDAAEAFAVGKTIGERVVLMGTSTGGTLAVVAAAREETQSRLAAVVLLSPNFAPREAAAQLLLWPWGGLLARLVEGPERCFEPANDEQARHWTTCYPTRALLPMMALVERAWTLDPHRVTAPLLTLYSSRDQVVNPDRIVAAHGRFASVPSRLLPVEGSPYGAYHVLAGDILAPESTGPTARAILDFLRSIPTD